MSADLLRIENLCVNQGQISILDAISFSLKPKQTLGIVGESGCGKSMTAWSVMRLLPPGLSAVEGRIIFKGQDLFGLTQEAMRRIRGRRIGMIFQDPRSAINPVRSIGRQMDDVIAAHFEEPKKVRRERAVSFLRQAELSEPQRILKSYAHQLSGGMLQRVLIAMALSLEPELLIADEPTTALDATIQLQILDLLLALQKKHGMAMILISHNLGVIARLCSQVVVMYSGRIAEIGATEAILNNPLHPYTQALLAARPQKKSKGVKLYTIAGRPPEAGKLHNQCKFEPRCPRAFAACTKSVPQMIRRSERAIACFLYQDQD